MPRFRSLLLLASAIVVLGAIVFGCARFVSGWKNGRAPALGAVTRVDAFLDYPLPLNPYRINDAQMLIVNRAHAALVTACMRRSGFPGYRAPDPVTPVRVDGPDVFGYLNLPRAERYGFHAPDADPDKSRTPGQARQDSRAEIAALSGTTPGGTVGGPAAAATGSDPAGGCVGVATRELRDHQPTGSALVTRLAVEAERRAGQDPRVVRATRDWSTCMKAAGYAYRTPAEPVNEQWAARPTRTETAIAAADVACTRQSNVAAVGLAVLTAVERDQVRANSAALKGVRASLDAQVRFAQQVLAGAQ